MKHLFLIRHAKSSWADFGLSDFDRPLNDRGKKDAPDMAKRLSKRKHIPQILISSPAKRAKKTAIAFANELQYNPDEILFVPELYLAGVNDFLSVIESIDDRVESAAIFSHNPGITELANSLTATRIDDMPTCAIFAVSIATQSWKEFTTSDKKFEFFDYPKLA